MVTLINIVTQSWIMESETPAGNEEAQDRQLEAFIVLVAHTIRLPITSILIDASNLLQNISKDDPNYETCEHLYNEMLRLQLEIDNLLIPIRYQSIQTRAIFHTASLFRLLKEACEMFKGEAESKGIEILNYIKIGKNKIKAELSNLDNKEYLYKMLLLEILKEQAKLQSDNLTQDTNVVIHMVSNKKIKKISLEILAETCFKIANSDNKYDNETNFFVIICGEKIELNIDKIAGIYLPDVEMSDYELSMAFKNLLHNAVKYSYYSSSKTNRYIKIDTNIDNQNCYEINISNFGVGIKEYEIEKGLIWRPRYRGELSKDRSRFGSGLGLATAKRVIEKVHNGKLTAKSIYVASGYLTTISAIIPVKQPRLIDTKE